MHSDSTTIPSLGTDNDEDDVYVLKDLYSKLSDTTNNIKQPKPKLTRIYILLGGVTIKISL